MDQDIAVPIKYKIDTSVGSLSRWPNLFLPDPVFDVRLIEVLKDAGVDPFQEFDVKISGKNKKGEPAPEAYKLINILNVVDCFNRNRSDFEEEQGLVFVDKLVINRESAQGKKMFRVKGVEEYLLISADVAKKIDRKKFPDVVLIAIETSS